MANDFARIIALPSADADYRFGRPKVYLTEHEIARHEEGASHAADGWARIESFFKTHLGG